MIRGRGAILKAIILFGLFILFSSLLPADAEENLSQSDADCFGGL